MRYTEARLSPIAALMLDDLKLDTVDFVPTYDERHTEPTVLPSKFPNLLVNGANGIAVGMATSIPPHNLGEVCDGADRACIDDPDVSIDELLEIIPGPDFPTGGIICGRSGIRRGYHTGRSTIVVRARATIEEHGKDRYRIVVTEIPYPADPRPVIEERIADAGERRPASRASPAIRNESDLKEPVRLGHRAEARRRPGRRAQPALPVLAAARHRSRSSSWRWSTASRGRCRSRSCCEEFIRHRVTVIRRRTQFLLARARAAEAHGRRPAAGPRQHRRE